jgi:methionine synthase II (cobalamin-independent)
MILIGYKHKVMSGKVSGYTEKIFTQDEVKDILKEIIDMVDDLGWEHQRMSTSGQETYEKLYDYLENL